MNAAQQLNKFHKTKAGYALFGLIELALMYLCASLAIDSGSLLFYVLTLLLLIGSLQNIRKAVWRK